MNENEWWKNIQTAKYFEFINRPGLKMDSERNPPTKQENPKNIQKSFINR